MKAGTLSRKHVRDFVRIRAFLCDDGWCTPQTYGREFCPIPAEPGVYAIAVIDPDSMFREGTIAYVGMSKCLSDRLAQHPVIARVSHPKLYVQTWFKRVRPNRLREVEAHYIRHFDPPLNIQGRRREALF